MDEREAAMRRAAELGFDYLTSLAERHVGPRADAAALRERLGGPLPEAGTDPTAVVEHLSDAAAPGLVASAGPRYFGFVVGGALRPEDRQERACGRADRPDHRPAADPSRPPGRAAVGHRPSGDRRRLRLLRRRR